MKAKSKEETDYTITENRIALLVLSLSSLIIYSLLFSASFITGRMVTLLTLFSVLVFIFSSVKLINSFQIESIYLQIVFPVFIIYEFIIIIRGWNFSYHEIKSYIETGYILWPFLIPAFIFFNKKISTMALLLKWIFIIGVVFLLLSIIFPPLLLTRNTAETFIGLATGCGFLLLNARYLSNKKVNYSFIILFIALLSLIYLSRRNGIVSLAGIIIASYFINIFNKSSADLFKFLPVIGCLLIFVLIYFDTFTSTLAGKLIARIDHDTRSHLFEMFFFDMSDNLLFGKGLKGTYYFPMPELEIDGLVYGEVEYRNIIENGYLQLLLTGGIIHILLFILILLPAAILGLFFSNNQFSQACGIIIFLWLLDMVIYGLPRLSLNYIVVWISVGICYMQSIRKLNNQEIMSEFEKI